jgi:hypothetical protein
MSALPKGSAGGARMVRVATVVRPTFDDPSVAVNAGGPSSQLKHVMWLRYRRQVRGAGSQVRGAGSASFASLDLAMDVLTLDL